MKDELKELGNWLFELFSPLLDMIILKKGIKPKKTVRKYLDPVSMVHWLIEHEYKISKNGTQWYSNLEEFKKFKFFSEMWYLCGLKVTDRWGKYDWHPEWIVEVEE